MGIFKRPRLGFPLTSLDVKGINDFFQAVMYKLTGNIDFGDMTASANNRIDTIEANLADKPTYDELVNELSDYITNSGLASMLNSYATNTSVANTVNNAVADKITATQLAQSLANYITSGTFSSTLQNYVTNGALTTKFGTDYIITGKILASQIAAGLLLGVTIKTSNTSEYVELQNQYVSMYRGNQKKVELGYYSTTGGMELAFINDAGNRASMSTAGDGFMHFNVPINVLHEYGTCCLAKGIGDGASWGSYNSRLIAWYGFCMGTDAFGGFTPKIMFDCRVGTFSTYGAIYGSSKSNVTETEQFGELITYADESPNHVHADRGRGQLDSNGECIIMLDPMYLATVSTKDCDYWVHLTGFQGANVEIKELQSDYFIVCGTPNKEFIWKVEAERKGYERLRFNDGAIDY